MRLPGLKAPTNHVTTKGHGVNQPRSQAPEYGGTAFDIAFQTEPARVTQTPSTKPSINMSALFGSIAVSSVMTCCVTGKRPIVCLPVCLLACLSACLSVCLFAPFCLRACLSVCLPACLPVCLLVRVSVCMSVSVPLSPSPTTLSQSARLHVCPSVSRPVSLCLLPVCLLVCPSISLFV